MSSNLTPPVAREIPNSPSRETAYNTTANTTTNTNTNNIPDEKLPVAISISDSPANPTSQTCSGSYPGTYASVPNTRAGYTPAGYSDPFTSTTTHYIEAPPQGSAELQKCWRYSKTVKCIAWIDAVFCFLNAFTYWPLIFLGIMPVVGYYGAKEYNPNKIIVYGVYCIMLVFGRILQLDIIYTHNEDDDNISHSDSSKVILFFSIFVQTWITWIVFRLISRLRRLSEVELNRLQIGTYTPVETRIIYY